MRRWITPPVRVAVLSTLIIVLAAMILNVHYGWTWMHDHHGWHWLLVMVKTNGKSLRPAWLIRDAWIGLAASAALAGLCSLLGYYVKKWGWDTLPTPTERETRNAELVAETARMAAEADELARRRAEYEASPGDDSL